MVAVVVAGALNCAAAAVVSTGAAVTAAVASNTARTVCLKDILEGFVSENVRSALYLKSDLVGSDVIWLLICLRGEDYVK